MKTKIEFLNERMARVRHFPGADGEAKASLAVPAYPQSIEVDVEKAGGRTLHRSPTLTVFVDNETGCTQFTDTKTGAELLEENAPGTAVTCPYDPGAFTVSQDFRTPHGEGLYGLGQIQNGVMNWRGHSASLVQANLTIAAPFLASSRGYGLFWDNTSQTAFGEFEQLIPAENLFHPDGRRAGLVADYYSDDNFTAYERTEVVSALDILWEKGVPDGWHEVEGGGDGARRSVRMKGKLKTLRAGFYHFRLQAPHGARLIIDRKVVIGHWGETCIFDHKGYCALPADSLVDIVLECQMIRSWIGSFLQLSWQTPVEEGTYRFTSEAADAIDYTFIYGPGMERVQEAFTALTGRSPMFPRWVFGLWQSKERYTSEAELESVVHAYRDNEIPLDLIVQDWRYWDPAPWGSHEVNKERYPDFAAFTEKLRQQFNVQIGLSVWTNFQPGSKNYDELLANDAFLPYGEDGKGFRFIDVFNEKTNELYWKQVANQLEPYGIDIWWLDATEPETVHPANANTLRESLNGNALGSGSRYLNAYALQNARGFADYMHPVIEATGRRPMAMTRSGFCGMARHGAVVWSGDTHATWEVLAHQVAAGVHIGMAGLPWWNMDIGGFFAGSIGQDWYEELFIRWFQYGMFVPLARNHGTQVKELHRWPEPVQAILKDALALRYRLIPYLYSLAWQVHRYGTPFMRPLAFHFPCDPLCHDINDQFLLGESLLVCPVLLDRARSRPVYLPDGAEWIDFHSGERHAGGQTLTVEAPRSHIPLFVKAGSLLPLAAPAQWHNQKPTAPLEIRIFPGSNARFRLFTDTGDGDGYMRGEYLILCLQWDDTRKRLLVSTEGDGYPGMPEPISLNLICQGRDPVAVSVPLGATSHELSWSVA
ncbi:MAG: TIM-barrel domain-containing protein, partial [Oceanipulchritudo sp.]